MRIERRACTMHMKSEHRVVSTTHAQPLSHRIPRRTRVDAPIRRCSQTMQACKEVGDVTSAQRWDDRIVARTTIALHPVQCMVANSRIACLTSPDGTVAAQRNRRANGTQPVHVECLGQPQSSSSQWYRCTQNARADVVVVRTAPVDHGAPRARSFGGSGGVDGRCGGVWE
jgi:hypothetical protein